ncbi:MAG: disulfide bond formation protein B [Moraxella sp.]|nr:disulfide bond formation protein B [Moraxella sp.]
MKKLLYSPRILFFILALFSVIGTAYALYLQQVLFLLPCNLCILQRIGLWVMGLFSLLFALVNPKKNWLKWGLWGLSFIGILWSFGVAVRHSFMIWFPPDEIPSCGASLDYLMQTVPALDALKLVLSSPGNCLDVSWTLFGLSIPEQSLIFFAGLTLGHLWLAKLIFKKS